MGLTAKGDIIVANAYSSGGGGVVVESYSFATGNEYLKKNLSRKYVYFDLFLSFPRKKKLGCSWNSIR